MQNNFLAFEELVFFDLGIPYPGFRFLVSSFRFPDSEFRGAFHYAKPTGQRSVGIPEENGTTSSD